MNNKYYKMKKQREFKSFGDMVFTPISNHHNGCIAGTKFHNNYSIIVWGGIDGQPADGANTYNVRMINNKGNPYRFNGQITLKQQSIDDIIGIMEHFQRKP